MRNYKNNFTIIFIISLLLVLFSSFILFNFNYVKETFPIMVEIRDKDNNKKEIEIFENKGQYYLYLPSYSNKSNTSFNILKDAKVFDGNIEVQDTTFIDEGKYIIKYLGKNKEFNILKSANISTMYISTKKNAIERIYNDKSAKEKISITIYDELGEIDYMNTNYEDKISGRGNSSWKQEKKPFNITLKQKNELLGMNSSTNWALLSNAYDSSNIRDLIYKRLATYSGFEYTPESKYVDLYINGKYNGLYQLSEKIDVEENRLSIQNNLFLCTFEYWQRWDELSNPLITDVFNVTINIEHPKEINDSILNEVESKIQTMENAIASDDGIDLISGKSLNKIIDIDSWAKSYLIDEITKNLDTNLASSYFYWNGDGVICKGPVWDGDRTLGSDFRNSNPNGFYATRIWRSKDNYNQYYSNLMKKDVFKNRVLQIYKETFVPIINDLIDSEIDTICRNISKASEMNMSRWSDMFSYLINYQNQKYTTCYDIKNYLNDRKEFLDINLENINDYCDIYLELEDGSYYVDNIIKGEKYNVPSNLQFEVLRNSELVNENNGKDFNFDNAINEDVRVVPKLEKAIQEEHENLITTALNNSKIITAVGTFVVLIVFMICLIIIDRKNIL